MRLKLALDRRAFLGGAGLAAGAVVATSLVPLSAVHALAADPPLASSGPEGDWHVDDICGHWPRYAHPIGYPRPLAEPSMFDYIDPVDRNFVTG